MLESKRESNLLSDTSYSRDDLFKVKRNWNYRIYSDDYLFLKTSSFISFFLKNNIDVPTCFDKSKSLNFRSFQLPLLKFFNFLMRRGKRDKFLKLFFKNLINSDNFFIKMSQNKIQALSVDENTKSENFLNTFYFSTILNNSLDLKTEPSSTHKNFQVFFYTIFATKFTNSFRSINLSEDFVTNFLKLNSDSFFKKSITNLFSEVNIVFSYYIYSVDKNVRKFSRGKSGKYSFIWKYVSPYKRSFLAMRLFVKDLKFRSEKNFADKFLNSIHGLKTNPRSTFIWQFKKYSHNFVFKNFKRSLLLSLKTTGKR